MRSVYFSFHYADIWRVNQVRNSGLLFGARSVGFADRSLWEEAKLKSAAALEELIDAGLEGTTVTVLLLGTRTASRKWVKYEIRKSIERGNALIVVRIHNVKDNRGRTCRSGTVPKGLREAGGPVYDWTNAHDLGDWVEVEWQRQNRAPSFWDRLAQLFE